jgi:hypothetical protein
VGQANCGSMENGFGPYDYRTATEYQRNIVETHHFTQEVEQLRSGLSSSIGGELSYTLRALPNHPRALWAMVRLSRKENTEKPGGSRYTVSCWFDRAVRFAPDDGEVRLLFGLWLSSKAQRNPAAAQLTIARNQIESSDRLKNDPSIVYNLGLGFFDVGRFEEALSYAKRAEELGFPLQGLKNKLRQANKWRD